LRGGSSGRRCERSEAIQLTPGTPEDYAGFIDKDEKKWSQLVKTSGVEQE
jgi:hypothetical protein